MLLELEVPVETGAAEEETTVARVELGLGAGAADEVGATDAGVADVLLEGLFS